MNKQLEIVLDCDGTVMSHEFPNIGNDIGAVEVLKELTDSGHRLILFTMRSDSFRGNYLTEAVNWFKENDIPLYGIQNNPTQHLWTTSPKAYGQVIIDDAAAGTPLKTDLSISSRPFVDWEKMREILIEMKILK